jgi:hypothetical protein
MSCKKLELNQETLKNLIHETEGLKGERERIAATFPPVCENTNFISCRHC